MPEEYKFKCYLKGVRTDEDGQSYITLTVPMTESSNLRNLSLKVKRSLEVSVKEE